MADRLLLVSWGATVRGREARALEVFNSAIGFYGRLQNEGRIESFDVALLTPTGAGIRGFVQLRGSDEQLAALRRDDEFVRITVDAQLIVDELALVDGYTGQGVADQMLVYQAAIAQVPQAV